MAIRQALDKPNREYVFGGFRFIPDRQVLLHLGRPVALGTRAMDLLHYLIVRAGDVVSKQDLTGYVWPGTYLHESNLKVNISALRRVLARDPADPDFIATIPGRGYRFVASVHVGDAAIDHRLDPFRAQSGDLPTIPQMIGRDTQIRDLDAMLHERGFVTIIGPAGVGKTSTAVAVARQMAPRFADGVRFADLATLDDMALVAPAVALALGVDLGATDVLPGLVAALKNRHMLLVLDNCEHVLNATAPIAEHLRAMLPDLAILATSREAMRSHSESLFRLAALDCPPCGVITAAAAMAYPAVRLLVRAAERGHGYRFGDAEAPAVAALCRRLDGIALALELAAPRLAEVDAAALLAMLDHGIAPLGDTVDSTVPRHRTLQAMLDWSYRRLPPHEAWLFRLLSVFAGPFAMADICQLAAGQDREGPDQDPAEIAAWTGRLVAKSLLSVTYRQGEPRYRLLDSTRSFAAAALDACGETGGALDRHAAYMLALLERAEAEWAWRERGDWTAAYGPYGHDLRKAIDWAFAGDHDLRCGIRLTAAAIALWDELSSVGESHLRVERALQAWDRSGLDDQVVRMKLIAAHGAALNYSERLDDVADAAWDEGFRLAASLGDTDYRLRTLWGRAVLQSFRGCHRRALDTLAQFTAVAEREQEWSAMPDGRRLALMTRFYLGEIGEAEAGLAALEREQAAVTVQARVARFQVDRLVGVRVGLAHAVWLRGDLTRAMAIAQSALDRADHLGHRVSQSNALAHIALPLGLQTGNLDRTALHLAALSRNLALQETAIWRPVLRFYQGAIAAAQGDPQALEPMQRAIDDLARNGFLARAPFYLATLGAAALRFDRIDLARSAIVAAGDRVDSQAEAWYGPEVTRLRGVLAWRDGDRDRAGHLLRQAARGAQAIGASILHLRSVLSLAELLIETDRRVDAVIALAPVYAGFDADSDSIDVRRAGALLASLIA